MYYHASEDLAPSCLFARLVVKLTTMEWYADGVTIMGVLQCDDFIAAPPVSYFLYSQLGPFSTSFTV